MLSHPKSKDILSPQQKISLARVYDPHTEEEEAEELLQAVENQLVTKGSCATNNPLVVEDMRINLYSLDPEKLTAVTHSAETLNPNFHDNLACITDAITTNNKKETSVTKIHNWFQKLRRVGEPSAEGVALATSISIDSDLYIIKAPLSFGDDNLAHEALAGFYVLNPLRHIVPNFMYVYAYAKCTRPLLEGREVINWCNEGTPTVSYLFNENIVGGVSLRKLITEASLTTRDYLDIFVQIINALHQAYLRYGFIHYDLHDENVLVRRFDAPIKIPFYGEGKEVIGYIYSNYVPFIIDYGFARFNIDGEVFMKLGFASSNIVASSPNPLYDTYKLLCFSADGIYQSEQTPSAKFSLLNQLFQFFGEGEIEKRILLRKDRIVNQGVKDYYALPVNFNSQTNADYLRWLEAEGFTNYQFASDNHRELNFNVGLDFYQQKPPANNFEFCNTLNEINENPELSVSEKESLTKKINQGFDSRAIFIKEQTNLDNNLKEIKQLRSTLTTISSARPLPLDEVYKHSEKLAKIQELYLMTKQIIESAICAMQKQEIYTGVDRGEIALYQLALSRIREYLEKEIRAFNDYRAAFGGARWQYGKL